MKAKCVLHIDFEFDDEDADSFSDAQWQALKFIQDHIMDDRETNPIKTRLFEIYEV